MRFFKKQIPKPTVDLSKGLEKSRLSFFKKLNALVFGKPRIEPELLEELESVLISSDVGVNTTLKLIDKIQHRNAKGHILNLEQLTSVLEEEVLSLMADATSLSQNNSNLVGTSKPHVILVVGVNGVGKTTTIGKLAYKLKSEGYSVLLGAGDTFRAAAISQLGIWAERVNCDLVAQQMGADPASVAHDTLTSALAKQVDVVIIDTAGRLHNKVNLMNELSKIKSVMGKVVPGAPHEVLLVLDGSTGQNAFHQAEQFSKATDVTGLVVTKLDGSAKGGVVIGISDQMKIPVKYVGVGEKIEDLERFDGKKFVQTFFHR